LEPFDLAVVGGGAAGFMTAITAADNGVKRIIILEGTSKLMEKVRISGGGRCNVTNATWKPNELVDNYPRGGIQLLESFNRFAAGDVYDWFEKKGLKLKIEDLINSANGSPEQLLKNIEIWNDISDEILSKLDSPIKNSLEILELSKLISEKLEIYQQICLVNLIQTLWWKKTKNIGLVKKLENLKYLLRKNVQPRLAWEIAFLKISMEDI